MVTAGMIFVYKGLYSLKGNCYSQQHGERRTTNFRRYLKGGIE